MEWKELKIDNLPSDILTGDYEFEYQDVDGTWGADPDARTPEKTLVEAVRSCYLYRYRKPEPKAPSHEDIMTLWWKDKYSDGDVWVNVTAFRVPTYPDPEIDYSKAYETGNGYKKRKWFINRESAVIPPEAL